VKTTKITGTEILSYYNMYNEYYSKDEARELISYLKREIENILRDHNELLNKHEALQEEFEQLKERYVNLAR